MKQEGLPEDEILVVVPKKGKPPLVNKVAERAQKKEVVKDDDDADD